MKRIIIFCLFTFIYCSDNSNGKTAPQMAIFNPILNNNKAIKKVYSIDPELNVRNKPGLDGRIITKLRNNIWVPLLEKGKDWSKIRLNSGQIGYVYNQYITNKWILILKKERLLYFMKNKIAIASYPIAVGLNPHGDKNLQGDGRTPVGRFYICKKQSSPKPINNFGARSLQLSYPDIEDARHGLKNGNINITQYKNIVKAIHNAKTPLQNTKLGGSIKIHGGGSSRDWTQGSIALKDSDIKDLYRRINKKNIMVEIYHDKKNYQVINSPYFMNKAILIAAEKLFKRKLKYTESAVQYRKLSFPMGDINPSEGVCTDVIIRTLRNINIDLQALLYEDILIYPKRYPKTKKANPNIDHRRTRVLKHWFDHNCLRLSNKLPSEGNQNWLPGDIVLFDTGINNGTIYDHIGIVGNKKKNGRYQVINLWTVGYELNYMDLLSGGYPRVVGHYRFNHLYDYSVIR